MGIGGRETETQREAHEQINEERQTDRQTNRNRQARVGKGETHPERKGEREKETE